jgi:hypothetical protein
MISKDAELIGEAYLSALQKQKDVVKEPAMEDIAEVNPEVTDQDNVEVVSAVPVNANSSEIAHSSIEPNAEDETEELWMARSNLFSLFSNAKKIHNAIQMGLDLEPWMQEKIAVAADSLEGVTKQVNYHAAEKGINC